MNFQYNKIDSAFKAMTTRFKNHDWVITIVTAILLFIGSVVIFSTTYNSPDQSADTMPKQLIFVIVGMIVYFLLSILEFSWLKARTILAAFYILVLALLFYVKFFGTAIASTNRWIDIGFFSLQPSEYAKLVLIMVTAAIFTLNDKVIDNKLVFFHSAEGESEGRTPALQGIKAKVLKYAISAALALPYILLTLIQPSLGNAVILGIIWLMMLFILFPKQRQLVSFIVLATITMIIALIFLNPQLQGNVLELNTVIDTPGIIAMLMLAISFVVIFIAARFKLLFLIIFPLLTVFLLGMTYFSWNKLLTNYQKDRLVTFMQGPESDPLGTGYQVRQSMIAIGSGRFWGRGFLQGTQSNLNVLTQAQTDFIFASLSEQFGFVGAIIVLSLYILLILRILKTGLESHDDYATAICVGIAILLLIHVFINVGMNLGKLPVTGIPLPLLSYGGSSVFLTLISLGIVQSISGSKRAVDISDTLMLRSQDRPFDRLRSRIK